MGVDTQAVGTDCPSWHDGHSGSPGTVPESVRAWIALETSMTQALARSFGAGVRVRVLADGAGSLYDDERGLLSAQDNRGFVREVVLHLDGQRLLAARTVYVSAALRRRLASLGERPLGELLFASGPPCRLRQQYALLSPHMPLSAMLSQAAIDAREPCWARRGLHRFEGHALLVTEVFLAPLLQRPPS